jgi:hypothetical protein
MMSKGWPRNKEESYTTYRESKSVPHQIPPLARVARSSDEHSQPISGKLVKWSKGERHQDDRSIVAGYGMYNGRARRLFADVL